jgi:hypothetical protein
MTVRKSNIGYEKGGKQSSMLGGCQAYEKKIEILLTIRRTKIKIHMGL